MWGLNKWWCDLAGIPVHLNEMVGVKYEKGARTWRAMVMLLTNEDQEFTSYI